MLCSFLFYLVGLLLYMLLRNSGRCWLLCNVCFILVVCRWVFFRFYCGGMLVCIRVILCCLL